MVIKDQAVADLMNLRSVCRLAASGDKKGARKVADAIAKSGNASLASLARKVAQ